MSDTYAPAVRTTPSRSAERVGYDRDAVHRVLDEAVLCHVGFVVDGDPVVLPQLHARLDDRLYLHGSTGARAMRQAREGGLKVCVTVTLVDGLVLARSAFHHSINFRSVVAHGLAVAVDDVDEKSRALAVLVDAVVPGRSAASRAASRKELAATTVLRLDLVEVSLKVRTGPPNDDLDDMELPHWAGVLPLLTRPGVPQPDPGALVAVDVPDHVTHWTRTRR